MQAPQHNPQHIQALQKMKAEVDAITRKIGELEAQRDEHSLVIKAISGLEAERRCYRMVGGVLVERSVGEVLPVLTTNRDNTTALIENLDKLLAEKNQAMGEFAKKHGIIGQQPKEEAPAQAKPEKAAGQGVLV
eukprot:TRINITY_DN8_c0_g1_i1.p1 TRINITY_DN8_c0_g1~~TRINITY_DN8_c0_g1_i1.p1  ORF type:complete len:134 (+),score=41.71 TRINITY_DN8_c0_g1_i1:175-576(+)